MLFPDIIIQFPLCVFFACMWGVTGKRCIWGVKMHIRNKISHPPFVVKMPKLVISLKDNKEKQNCSKQQYCNKRKLLQRLSTKNQHLKHAEKEIRPWKCVALLHNPVNEWPLAQCCRVTTPLSLVCEWHKPRSPWARIDSSQKRT